jgi:hypothetical protein
VTSWPKTYDQQTYEVAAFYESEMADTLSSAAGKPDDIASAMCSGRRFMVDTGPPGKQRGNIWLLRRVRCLVYSGRALQQARREKRKNAALPRVWMENSSKRKSALMVSSSHPGRHSRASETDTVTMRDIHRSVAVRFLSLDQAGRRKKGERAKAAIAAHVKGFEEYRRASNSG